jgi:nucleoside-diphosphate-sugar epimerase
LIWSDKNVLVTGGAGFIGSHLVKKLLELGSAISVADDFSRGKRKNIEPFLDKINLHIVDLTKLENCVKVTEGVNYVFHLAATVGGIHYIKKENVGGSTPRLLMNTNMLEAARLNDVQRFLFTSSACIYREKTLDLTGLRKRTPTQPTLPPLMGGLSSWGKYSANLTIWIMESNLQLSEFLMLMGKTRI